MENNIVYRSWNKLSLVTRVLCKLLLLNLIFVSFILVLFLSTPVGETIFSKLKLFLLLRGGSATWEVLSAAYDYILSGFQQPAYSEFFFRRQIKLQYPPTNLLLLLPFKLTFIGNALRTFNITIYSLLNLISWISLVATVYILIRIFKLGEERYLASETSSSGNNTSVFQFDSIVKNIALICLIGLFYPLLRSYEAKQVHLLANFLATLSFWFWLKRAYGFSGLLIGFVCLIEPQYLSVLVWGVIRRHKIFLFSGVITYTLGLFFSILIFGWANHTSFLDVLAFVSRHGEGFYPNQSINGLLNRLFFNGNNLMWEDSFPPFHPIVYVLSVVSSAVLLGIAFLGSRGLTEAARASDFLRIIIACTMACPVVWELNYTLLLPAYVYLTPWLLSQKSSAKKHIIIWFFASYLLTSNYLFFTKKFASIPLFNVFQSYLLIGALILFFVVHRSVKLLSRSPSMAKLPVENDG